MVNPFAWFAEDLKFVQQGGSLHTVQPRHPANACPFVEHYEGRINPNCGCEDVFRELLANEEKKLKTPKIIDVFLHGNEDYFFDLKELTPQEQNMAYNAVYEVKVRIEIPAAKWELCPTCDDVARTSGTCYSCRGTRKVNVAKARIVAVDDKKFAE